MAHETRTLRLADGTVVTLDVEDFWRFWKHKLFVANGYICFRDEEGRIRRLHREVLEVRDKRMVGFLDGNTRNCTRQNLYIQDRSAIARSRPALRLLATIEPQAIA